MTDVNGAARSLPVEQLEVRCYGRQGRATWEPLAERACRAEQLRLL